MIRKYNEIFTPENQVDEKAKDKLKEYYEDH